ncbi:MAG: alcohol dehydrogenase catalytic domain-containing protein [Hyphomicrobiaceae bacterium]|nr:alcohol dehydrogenase catalytic domain-containing protein [Hyphomicrobiaceae bacterium]
MKALVYTGPKQLSFQDMPDPAPEGGETLIEVDASGICGSDMHAWLGHDERRPAPLILGHEVAGMIIAGPSAGTRVVVNPLVTCGTCEMCLQGRTNICPDRQIISMPPREGGFAGLLRMPERNLHAIPADFAAECAALTEPIACGWHAIRLARDVSRTPLRACRAVVLGGGAIGLGAALVLVARGVRDIFIAETNPERHNALREAGPFTVYDPALNEGPAQGSAHIVVDAFGGTATRKVASALAAPGGVIVHIGLADGEGGLDVRRMTLQEITFIGTYTYTAADFSDTLAAMIAGQLGALDWAEVRPLEEGAQAFKDILDGKATAPKIMLRP